jgi:hypothetical protein
MGGASVGMAGEGGSVFRAVGVTPWPLLHGTEVNTSHIATRQL